MHRSWISFRFLISPNSVFCRDTRKVIRHNSSNKCFPQASTHSTKQLLIYNNKVC